MSTAVVEQPKLVAARRESSFATGLDKVPLEPNSTTAKPEVRHAGTRPSLPRNRPSLQGQLPLDHDQPFPSSALGLPTERKAPLFTPMEDEGHGHMQPFDQAFADSLKPETQHQAFPIVHSQNMSSTAPSTPSQRPNSYSNESNETQRHESAVPSPQLASTMAASLCSIESGASSLTDPVSPAPSIVASGDRRVRQQSTSSSHKPVNLHGRRSSVISIAGFTELGSGESLAAPPTLSDAESHHWHTHSSTSRPRISSITNGNIMDAPFNGHASLPAPLLPTLNNLHSSTHMARIRSDPGYEIHLPLPPAEETASRSISPRNPLSTSGGGLSRSSTRTSATSSQMHRMSVSEQEQEEPDFNPLYLLLSNSTDPDLQIAFERAGLVIVPPRDTCPPTTEMLSNPEWVKSHAFRSDQSTSTTSRWISLGKHRSSITLNKGHISISDAASSASPRKADEPASKTVSPHLSATVAPLAAQSTPSPPLSHRSSRTSIAASVPFPTVASGDDEDEDEILIPFRPSPAPPRAITFSNETTVYRKKYASGSTTSSTAAARPRTKSKSKLPTKIKTPKWMQRVSFSKPFASPAAELARESPSPAPSTSSEETGATLAYEMLRLIAVDEPLWPWYNAPEQSPAGHIPQANHATTEASAEAHKFALSDEYDPIPATRNFMQDLSYLVNLADGSDGRALAFRSVFQDIVSWCEQYCISYIYVKNWESHTMTRIRTGVLEKAWGDLVELFEAESRLFLMIENIAMGVMHQKIYAQSILRHYASDNTALNSILDAYRSRVTLVDFECHLPVTCARAIAILAKLAPGAPDSPSERERAVVENATRISLHVLSDSHFLDQSTRAIPPFDVIVCIREAIDALVQEAEDVGHARIGTDELLPLVAFSLVKSGVKNLYTIGLYARKFTQNSLGPDYEWSLVTFRAASDYLAEDPLSFLHANRAVSPAAARRQSPTLLRRHTEDLRISPVSSQSHFRLGAPCSHLSRCTSSASIHADNPLPSGLASRSTPSLLPLSTHLSPNLDSEADSALSVSPLEAETHTDGTPFSNSTGPAFTGEADGSNGSGFKHRASRHSFSVDDTDLNPLTPLSATSPAFREDQRQRLLSHIGPASANEAGMSRSRSSSLSKSGSDVSTWTSLFGYTPASGEPVASPPSSAPSIPNADASNDWIGWTRRRISSVTSLGSVPYGSPVSEERKPHGATADPGAGQRSESCQAAPHAAPTWERGHRPRPLSTISLASSCSGLSEASSEGPSCLTASSSMSPVSLSRSTSSAKRARRASKLRRDLLVSGTSGSAALPPQLDFASAVGQGGSTPNSFLPPISPIREAFDPPPSTVPSSSYSSQSSSPDHGGTSQ